MRWGELAAPLRAAEQWLLPGVCLLCGDGVGPEDPLVCAPCQSRWRAVPEPQCGRCGQPLGFGSGPCRLCAAWEGDLARVRSAVWLDDGARRTVHQLKYAGYWRVAEPMARRMARLGLVSPGVTLVPVPLSGGRRRRRGYNQAEALALALSRATGAPTRADWLRRVRETPTQTRLTPEARTANVAGAFGAGPLPRGARVVLIDDVFTTGATLVEAAAALAEAGAGTVEAVTFARARTPVR